MFDILRTELTPLRRVLLVIKSSYQRGFSHTQLGFLPFWWMEIEEVIFLVGRGGVNFANGEDFIFGVGESEYIYGMRVLKLVGGW